MAITLAQVAKLAKQQLAAEHEVELKELELKTAKEKLRVICEETIPSTMEELGLEKVETKDGLTVEVKDTLRASITKANESGAFAWLRGHGHAALIKQQLVVIPADAKERTALEKKLAKHQYEAKDSVHANTLSAWVREMMEKGETVPEKLLGVYRQRVSKVTVK